MFSPDFVPSNLDEAVGFLREKLTEKDIEHIKHPNTDAVQAHFTVGMAIRNEWSLWDTSTRLVQWFEQKYGVKHADDISSIILDCLWKDVRGEPRRDNQIAIKCLKHWQEIKNQNKQ